MKRRLACCLVFLMVGAAALAHLTAKQQTPAPTAHVAPHKPSPAQPAKAHTSDAFPRMSTPKELRIPVLDIISTVRAVGTAADGTMDIPDSLTDTGWYNQSVHPGNPGKAVLAAHTGYPNKPSQFRSLERITPGTNIEVTDTTGTTAHFSVIQIARYNPDNAPLKTIFGSSPTARLTIVTCAGTWDATKNSYTERLVIYAARTK